MRHYQVKKNNDCKLPHELYMSILYLVRYYDKMRLKADVILHSSPLIMSHTNYNSFADPTATKAIQRAEITRVCDAIDAALEEIPPEYRKGVMNNICGRKPFPIDAGEATYGRWRSRLIYGIAKKISFL